MSLFLKSKLSPALASDNLSPKLIGFVWGMVFLLKLLMAFYYHKLTIETHPEIRLGSISLASGDNESYLGAMENYIKTGNYFFINPKGDTVRAGRSPYYALPYLVARQYLPVGKSADILMVINICLDSTAVLCISLLAMSFLNIGVISFYLMSFLGAISLYVSSWNTTTLPDSPAASLLIIGVFILFKMFVNKRLPHGLIILSSFSLTWAVMLRPFLSLVVAFFSFIYLYKLLRNKQFILASRFFITSSIVIIFVVSPWVIRNQIVFNKFILFQVDPHAGYGYKGAELKLREFLTTMGEPEPFWEPKAMASIFYSSTFQNSKFKFPSYLSSDSFFIRKFEDIRFKYINLEFTESHHKDQVLANQIGQLKKYYEKTYPVRSHLLNPLLCVYKFWFHSGSYILPVKGSSGIERVLGFFMKIVQSILYYLPLLIFCFYVFQLFSKRNLVFFYAPIVILTPFLFFFGALSEPRYLLSFYYPALLVCFVSLFRLFFKIYTGRQIENSIYL